MNKIMIVEKLQKETNNTIARIKELQKLFNMSDENFALFEKFFSDKIVLADHDGSICDTNQVKDELLGEFCRTRLGRADKNKEIVQDATVNAIHRGAHGLPMNMIFVDIVKTVYGREISLEEGQKITEDLNDYIRPNYMNRKMYDKAGEYHELLHLLGVKQYILTGMENDMIEASLKNHKIDTYFDGILGSQKKKTEWVNDISKQYMDKSIFATGDAISEYKATKTEPATIFIGLDFEDRKTRVFPEEVPVATTYDSLVAKIIMTQKAKEKQTEISLARLVQNQR